MARKIKEWRDAEVSYPMARLSHDPFKHVQPIRKDAEDVRWRISDYDQKVHIQYRYPIYEAIEVPEGEFISQRFE